MPNEELPQSQEEQNDFFPILCSEEEQETEAEVFSFEQLRDAFVRFRDTEKNDSEENGIETDETFSEVTSSVPDESDSSVMEDSHVHPSETFDDTNELTPQTVLEAMLFVGNRDASPLTPQRAAQLMRNVSPEEVGQFVDQLNERYRFLNKPYHIESVDEGYRMTLRSEFDQIRANFYGTIRKTRLSQAAIDVLAIVAYKQPVSCDDVQKIRKASSNSILTLLVKRGLLETETIPKSHRTQFLYRTTEHFLKVFKIESLSDLPLAEDIIS